MVGLAASELQAETLFPGDTIEYFSMVSIYLANLRVYVYRQDSNFGFPRLYRHLWRETGVATAWRKFCASTTQMMNFLLKLPMTIMLKRKRDRNGGAILSDAKWRKLRTFRLVNGEAEGVTRADRLNLGLKQSLSDAMKSTKQTLAMEKQKKAELGSKKLMNMYLATLDVVPDERKTSSGQHRSQERVSTSDHNRNNNVLLCQDYKEKYSKVQLPSTVVANESSDSHEPTWISRHEDDAARSKQKYGFHLQKRESHQRKQSTLTLNRHKKIDVAPNVTQTSISRYFDGSQLQQNRPKHVVGPFVSHVEESSCIQKKLERTPWDGQCSLNKTDKAHERERERNRDQVRESHSVHAVDLEKMSWKQQRKNYRMVNGGSNALRLRAARKSRRGYCDCVGTCVGETNRRLFVFYLFLQLLECAVMIQVTSSAISEGKDLDDWLQINALYLILWFMILCVLLLVLTLFCYQAYLISTNQTSWEHARRSSITYLQNLPDRRSPFDRGIVQNWWIFITNGDRNKWVHHSVAKPMTSHHEDTSSPV
ncbi:hypothetical protein PsorP6_000860 [Peronosclerospora sorghi]|uniref:Uncharacterized protein n=1 Tax=Peronosclerospora sorghi TaxID=230839 RepID=A0ACC0WR00_9STRA|nr:hypothetical protein PsorP6_000860 [Peronosclerospora sorghi]